MITIFDSLILARLEFHERLTSEIMANRGLEKIAASNESFNRIMGGEGRAWIKARAKEIRQRTGNPRRTRLCRKAA